VPLADGSLVAINTKTALEVAMKPKSRHIVLKEGEAWFQVAKDPQRPFVVAAGRSGSAPWARPSRCGVATRPAPAST
jgi:ferric-dicitrate binding protein FerR (iron transport regulator)